MPHKKTYSSFTPSNYGVLQLMQLFHGIPFQWTYKWKLFKVFNMNMILFKPFSPSNIIQVWDFLFLLVCERELMDVYDTEGQYLPSVV